MMGAEEVKDELEKKLEVGFGQDKADGEPVYVRVAKAGKEMYLSPEQARSLAEQITKKLE